MRLFLSYILLLCPLYAQAAKSLPNDCWFGVMTLEKASHGRLVATGPVVQWRVGMSLVLYPTRETYEQVIALTEKGKTGTFDISHPITIVPTWISGPEPGNEDTGKHKSIEITILFRAAEGESGTVMLTYWTPTNGQELSLPPDQRAIITQIDQQSHEMSCRGIP